MATDPEHPRKAPVQPVYANVVSRVLSRTHKRHRDVYERGGHTLHAGFTVTQPESWSRYYRQEVYVRYVGYTSRPEHPAISLLDQYALTLIDAGYTVVRNADTLYVTRISITK